MTAAMASLRTEGYDPSSRTEIAAGFGTYKGQQAVALGLFHHVNRNVMLNASWAHSNDENMGGAGITFRIGSSNGRDNYDSERNKTAERIAKAQERAIEAHKLYLESANASPEVARATAAESRKIIRESAAEEAAAQKELQQAKETYNATAAPSFRIV